MARASIIYLILNPVGVPEYAFTVRHEAQRVWKDYNLRDHGYRSIRLRDGFNNFDGGSRITSACNLDAHRDGAF